MKKNILLDSGSCHGVSEFSKADHGKAGGGKNPLLVVTGNPNVGKSVIFGLLTGRYTTVSNYPGTTVMIARGNATLESKTHAICDTPGINTMAATSEDELVARDLLMKGDVTALQVCDAKNLLRALTLTLELAEAGVPSVLNLNMIDEAQERRTTIDMPKLSALLGIPVIPTIATQRWGIDKLRKTIAQSKGAQARVTYPAFIEEAMGKIQGLLPKDIPARRTFSLLWLAGDKALKEKMKGRLKSTLFQDLNRMAGEAQAHSSKPLGMIIAQARLREAQRIMHQVAQTMPLETQPLLQRLGMLAMHPLWGLFVLGAVLYGMYFLVGDLAAGRGVDFLENGVFGNYLVPAARWVVEHIVPWTWLRALLTGEYGLLTMALPYAFAIILPIVGMFFLCFGFLEDVGYLPRLAVMANRFCRLVGLNGKAVLPLVLGLGCDTMATMTTRILDSKRDRILVTLLLALGIPCSAQLGVIMAMLAGLPRQALWIWLGVVVAVILIVGQVASRLVRGDESPFLYEIPPIRKPKLSNVLIKTLGRLEWYLKEAVPLFFLGTLILFLLDAVGVLGMLERWASPVIVAWLGLPAKTTGAFLVGFLRRDFGAAGLYALRQAGQLSDVQTVVSLVTITLFVPCIAQYFMMIKERGWKTGTGMMVLISIIAVLVGGLVLRGLQAGGILL